MSLNLNSDSIRRANDASHFNAGTVRAREAQSVYDSLLPLFKPKPEHTDEQREYLERRAAEWRALVERAYNDIIARRASWVPVTVAGPSNYPSGRMGKRADGEMRATGEWHEKMERFEANTHKGLLALEPAELTVEKYRRGYDAPIMSDDPQAAEKLEARLTHLSELQDYMKRLNAFYKKHGSCKGFESMNDDQAIEFDAAIENGYSWQKQPFPAYALQNNNANIRRIMARLEDLEKIRSQSDKAAASRPTEHEGFRIVHNADVCRIQILFDEKPDEQTRALLKSHGFRWAPSAGAWQRLLNQNGICAANNIAAKLGAQ